MNNLVSAREIMEGMERLVSIPIPLKLVAFDNSVCDMDTSVYCAHAHYHEDDKFYGQICINPPWLKIAAPAALRGIIAHEVAHFIHPTHDKKHDKITRFLLHPNPFRRAVSMLRRRLPGHNIL